MKPIHAFRKFLRVALGLAMLATGATLVSCDSGHQVAGGSDETHSSVVDIQGRVLTKDARPYANVIVRLRGLGILDTTDSDGAFRFQLDSLPLVAGRALSAVDTVDYFRDGQAILSAAVPAWIATMPDVMLVQRDLSGALSGDVSKVARVVCLLVLPDGTSRDVDLELNRVSRRYSGFAYFRYTGGVDSFVAVVKLQDDSGRLLGRSAVLGFSSRAGDIDFPSFAVSNVMPRVRLFAEDPARAMTTTSGFRLADTAGWKDSVAAGRLQKIHLRAVMVDSFRRGGVVEWNLGGGWIRVGMRPGISASECPGCYAPTGDSGMKRIRWYFDTIVTVPAAIGVPWRPQVRMTNPEGIVVADTLVVGIHAFSPGAKVDILTQDIEGPGSLRVQLSDSARSGRTITSRRLFIGRVSPDYWTSQSGTCALYPIRSDSGWWNLVDAPDTCEGPWTNAHVSRFLPSGPGISVSGADTVLIMPTDSVGIFQLLYEVVDSEGDTTVVRSPCVTLRAPGAMIDSLGIDGDSLVVHWSVSSRTVHSWSWNLFPQAHTDSILFECGWFGTPGGWRSPDLLGSLRQTITIHGASGAHRILIPEDVRSLTLSAFRIYDGIYGYERAGSSGVDTLPAPVLTFDDANPDTLPRRGFSFVAGDAMAQLTGRTGDSLPGAVARFRFRVGDPFDSSVAGCGFRMKPVSRPRALRLDIANRSALPVRAYLIAPDVAQYAESTERGIDLGWDIPAGFVGSLELGLDSASWPAWSTVPDRSVTFKSPVFAAITAIGFRVATEKDPVVHDGVVEFDNVTWE